MFLVTGATGHVGRELVPRLVDEEVPVRALARAPGNAGLPTEVEVVGGDLRRPETLVPALRGVESVFLLWPFTSADGAEEAVAVIARYARRVVYLSSAPAPAAPETAIGSTHARLEELVRGSGLDWTMLRPCGFATNTLGWAAQVRAGDVVRAPLAGLARPLIHERDIAASAVRVLVDGGHSGAAYHLTGPACVSQRDQVRAIGEALGRPLRYEEQPLDGARAELAAAWGAAAADSVLAAWRAMVDDPEPVTDGVSALTGCRPRGFRAWAFDHADDFR